MSASERVTAEVERNARGMREFLAELVRARTTVGNEEAGQEVVEHKLRELGLAVERYPVRQSEIETHPAFARVGWPFDGRTNVVGTWAGTGGGRSVVLNGHVDVVSPEPVGHWTHDPWGAEIVGGRMYGRGALDMKGGFAMLVLAVEAVRAADIRLRGGVFVESVIEEEASGNGTLAARLHGTHGDAAIVAEPKGLRMDAATLGVMWFKVTVRGRASHANVASSASINAIEKCFLLIAALKELEREMNDGPRHRLYEGVDHPINLVLGTMHGGDWPSTVPAECSFECRLAWMPGDTYEGTVERVRRRIAEAADADPWLRERRPEITFNGFRADPAVVPLDSSFVRTLAAAHERVLREKPGLSIATSTNDARYFVLYFDTPATAYGPRGGGQHGIDEYVELDSVVDGAKVIAQFLLDWNGVADR